MLPAEVTTLRTAESLKAEKQAQAAAEHTLTAVKVDLAFQALAPPGQESKAVPTTLAW